MEPPDEKSHLLQDAQNPVAAPNPDEFTGHYRDYNVPYHFQQLVLSIYNLRLICKSEKYQQHFSGLRDALYALFQIILNNNLQEGAKKKSAISLEYTQISERLAEEIHTIISIRKNRDSDFTGHIGNFTVRRKTIVDKLLYAFSAHQNLEPGKHPAPEFIDNSLTPSQILNLINEIQDQPSPPPFWHIIPHAFTYSRKTMIGGVILLSLAVGASLEYLQDKFFPEYKGYTVPLVLAIAGLLTMLAGITLSRRKKIGRYCCSCWRRPSRSPGEIEQKDTIPLEQQPLQIQVEQSPVSTNPVSTASTRNSVRLSVAPLSQQQNSKLSNSTRKLRHQGFRISKQQETTIPTILDSLKEAANQGNLDSDNNFQQSKAIATLRAYLTNPEANEYDPNLADQIREFLSAQSLSDRYLQFSF